MNYRQPTYLIAAVIACLSAIAAGVFPQDAQDPVAHTLPTPPSAITNGEPSATIEPSSTSAQEAESVANQPIPFAELDLSSLPIESTRSRSRSSDIETLPSLQNYKGQLQLAPQRVTAGFMPTQQIPLPGPADSEAINGTANGGIQIPNTSIQANPFLPSIDQSNQGQFIPSSPTGPFIQPNLIQPNLVCLLYTSDAADE